MGLYSCTVVLLDVCHSLSVSDDIQSISQSMHKGLGVSVSGSVGASIGVWCFMKMGRDLCRV